MAWCSVARVESGTALGGSLSFYTPEANALRLLTQARPSMVCSSALGPRAKVSQIEVGLMLLSSRHNPYARACAAILREVLRPSPFSSGADAGSRTVTGDS